MRDESRNETWYTFLNKAKLPVTVVKLELSRNF